MDFRALVLLIVSTICYLSDMAVSKGFPNIKGPKSLDDRIAIVGAGPSGIHMAYKLEAMGFKNITVFEKENRIGGKSWSLLHRGDRHEMGSAFLTVDYGEIFNLVKEFGLEKETILPPRTQYLDYFEIGGTFDYLAHSTGISDPNQLKLIMVQAVTRYCSIHKQLFGDYLGELMPRPNASVLHEIRGTFLEFLDRNNLTILEALFNTSHTLQGYGRLDKIGALYGLFWMTPTFTQSLLGSPSKVYYLPGSYQPLWEKIAKSLNITFEFEVDILKITRNNDITIEFVDKKVGRNIKHTKHFDFLILSPSMPSLKNVVDFRRKENKLFSKLTDVTYIVSTLVDSSIGRRIASSPIDYYSFNQKTDGDYLVWLSLDYYSMIHNISGEEYKSGLQPGGSDGCSYESRVYYQIGRGIPRKRQNRKLIKKNLKTHLLQYKKNNAKVIERKTWTYFTRFPPSAVERGLHWDIFDIQGQYNTWYIGSSVCFESIKSVAEYNNLIMRNFNFAAQV